MKRDFIYNGIHVGEHGCDPFIGELMGEPFLLTNGTAECGTMTPLRRSDSM